MVGAVPLAVYRGGDLAAGPLTLSRHAVSPQLKAGRTVGCWIFFALETARLSLWSWGTQGWFGFGQLFGMFLLGSFFAAPKKAARYSHAELAAAPPVMVRSLRVWIWSLHPAFLLDMSPQSDSSLGYFGIVKHLHLLTPTPYTQKHKIMQSSHVEY